MKKKVFVTMLTLAVMLSSSVVCYAAGTGFTRKFVDSNQWTHIEYDLKEGNSLMGKVRISTLYDANGNYASNYKYLRVSAGQPGGSTIAERGVWTSLSYPAAAQMQGQYVPLYGMGNNPSLDCYASGTWDADY